MVLTTQELSEYIGQAHSLYHQLLLLVMPRRTTKYELIYASAREMGCDVVNINLELSRQLIELTHRQRKLQVGQIFEGIVEHSTVQFEPFGRLAFIDNIEILFEPSLEIHILNLLQKVSRGRIVVSTWTGRLIDNSIVYAQPGHPEYKRYIVQDFFALSADETSRGA